MNKSVKLTHWLWSLLVVLTALALPWPTIQAAPPSPATIRLQYAVFDPLAGEPAVPAHQRLQATGEAPATYLLQFTGPVQDDWKAQVQAAGARLYGYIPEHAFLARMDGATAERVQSLPFVRWVGFYHPAYRLAPDLQADKLEATAAVTVMVQTLPDTDLDTLIKQVEALGGTVEGRAANGSAGYLRATVTASRLPDLARLDPVLWIESYFEPELCNDVGGGAIMRADAVRADLGLYGSGQIVAVADTGLDVGNLSMLHPDVRGRVIQTYALGRPGDWSDYNGHGTHVAGSVLGNGAQSGSNAAAHQYTGSYAGVAPEAQLVFQSLYDANGSLGGIPADAGDLMRTAYGDGARIHTNSWGAPTGGTAQNPTYGGYATWSQQVDQAMWDHQDMLVLYAVGNSGTDVDKNGVIDPDSIGQPGTAKNTLSVGASENNRPGIAQTWGASYGEPVASDQRANHASGMAAFSSRGPTDDGRIKPDVAAPGTFIASLRTGQYTLDDDMEGDTSGYTVGYLNGGTGNTWQLTTDAPHSPTHYWQNTVNGSFTPGAMTVLLTPQMNVLPIGGTFDLYFWHKYNLGVQDHLLVVLADGDGTVIWLTLNLSGSQNTYTLQTATVGVGTLLQYNVDPTTLRIGFAIKSDDATINSQWWVDDVRVDGSDWGTMSSVGLTPAGSTVDESYVTMGGTSMATPLTAGAAALAREWLTRIQGASNPSGALMKAVLVNGAADMNPGQYGTGGACEIPALRPNTVTGWGRVDLVGSLNPPAPRQVWFTDHTTGLGTGGAATYSLTIGASLVAPGPVAGATLTVPPPQPDTPRLVPVPGTAAVSIESVDQLVQNGGFEQDGSWTIGSTARTTTQHHTGSWSMGSTAGADGYFYQTTNMPADAVTATLTYYWKNTSPDVDYDTLQVWIYDEAISSYYGYGPAHSASDTNWHGIALDFASILDEVRGQTISVLFFIDQDGATPHATFYTDDVALYVGRPGGAMPTLTVTPASGPRGTTFAVTGSNFAASDTVTIAVDGVDQFDVTSDGSGSLAFNLTPPGTVDQGTHTVTATDTGAHSASDTFAIVPQVSVDVSPASGQPGDSFTVTGSGFHGGSAITVKLDGATAGAATATSAGAFTYNLNTSPSIASGSHTVSATDDEASTGADTLTISGTPPQTGGPFRITLAWTDYPGQPTAAKALVNDLDLEVIAPNGTHYYGNQGVYASGQCLRGGHWDACNNVEGVIIPEATYGTYTVIVHGYNVAQGPQPFALVAAGDNLQAGGAPPVYDHVIYLPLVLKNQ